MSDACKGFFLVYLVALISIIVSSQEKNLVKMPLNKNNNRSGFQKAQKRAIEEGNKRERALGHIRELSRMAQEDGATAREAQ